MLFPFPDSKVLLSTSGDFLSFTSTKQIVSIQNFREVKVAEGPMKFNKAGLELYHEMIREVWSQKGKGEASPGMQTTTTSKLTSSTCTLCHTILRAFPGLPQQLPHNVPPEVFITYIRRGPGKSGQTPNGRAGITNSTFPQNLCS